MLPKALVAASLRPIILSIVSDGETYGYDIIHRIHTLSDGKIQWTAGTLYPVLHRLETQGLIESIW
jgi:DNA-binding PadR family transcriptional regulator